MKYFRFFIKSRNLQREIDEYNAARLKKAERAKRVAERGGGRSDRTGEQLEPGSHRGSHRGSGVVTEDHAHQMWAQRSANPDLEPRRTRHEREELFRGQPEYQLNRYD